MGNDVLISVGKEGSNTSYAKEACDFIYEAVNLASSNSTNSKCVWLPKNEMVNDDVRKELKKNNYLFHIDYRESFDGKKTLRVVNLDREDDTDMIQSIWTLDESDPEYKTKVAKLIKQSFEAKNNIEEIKLALLANGLKESNTVDLTAKGQFIDRATGIEISGKEAYNTFKDESPKNKHYLRAGIELATALGFGAIHYQIEREAMSRDWDFPTAKEAWRSKVVTGKAYRFDDNSHGVNEGHSYAGMIYYMIARSNGFTSLESALYNLAASSAWEFLVEYREVVSINDQILTPLGGFAIGEAYHQIAKIFRKNKNSVVDQTLSAIFDTPTAMNSWIDGHYGSSKGKVQYFDTDFWSKVDIEMALVPNSSNKVDGRATVDAQIINIGSFEKEGKTSRLISDTVFSQILYSIPVNQKTAMEDFRFTVKNVLAAYYEKNIGTDKNGNIKGYSLIIGPSNGVDFYETNKKSALVTDDWMSIVNVLGTTMRLDMYLSGYKISTTIDLFGDFAMVRSYAINKYKLDNPSAALTSVLKNQNYYYGLGTTSSLAINVSKGKIDFGAKYRDHSYSSINSYYRNDDPQDLDLKDSKKVAEVYASYQVTKNLKLKLSLEKTYRQGGINNFGVFEKVETKKVGTLVYNFR